MTYKVDWTKPVEWDDGALCVATPYAHDDELMLISSPDKQWYPRVVYSVNGCGFLDGPHNHRYVRNVKEEVKMSSNKFYGMSDQDLADQLKDLEEELEEVAEELIRREYKIDGSGCYDVPNASEITKTVSLEVRSR